ncbi:MAG: zf-HC2 domain-containing protein [bacterium]
MECKEIQELLLTDYLDGEAGDTLQNEVERHLTICHQCRYLERALRKKVSEPLRKAKKSRPPESVWNRVQEAIADAATVQKSTPSERFLVRLRNFSPLFEPVLALAAVAFVALVLIIGKSMFQTHGQRVAGIHPEKQIEYLADVIGDSEYFSIDENGGYGTAIEECFF